MKHLKNIKISILTLPLLIFPPALQAQVPEMINYQGRLINDTNLVNSNVSMIMRLYDDPAAGSLLYADSNTVTVADGVYNTYLGDDTIYGSLTSALTNTMVYLELEVDGTTLSPRERLLAVPYALRAKEVETSSINSKVQGGDIELVVYVGLDGSYNYNTNHHVTFSPPFKSKPALRGISYSHVGLGLDNTGFTYSESGSGTYADTNMWGSNVVIKRYPWIAVEP